MRFHFAVLSTLLTLGACTPWARPEATTPVVPHAEAEVRVDSVRVEVAPPEMARLEQRVAVLQLQLLERGAQNQRLAEQLREARQEVVRTMAKLQSQANRAEAATGMAEAEVAVQTLASLEGGRSSAEYAEARALLDESTAQFDAGNFGGALYLATYARAAATSGRRGFTGLDGRELVSGETLFALPIAMTTTSRSNVRSGPGLDFSVQFVLDAGASITGVSYSGAWVRVVDHTGGEGWIFHQLVAGRR